MPRHDFAWFTANMTVRDVVRALRNLPLTAEIRTRFQYSNTMFIAASHFVETWTGMWLGDFLRTRIYEPLGMTSTFFSLKDAQKAEASGGAPLASGYFWANSTEKYEFVHWMDSPQVSGAGATISNVLDFTRWLRCHMTGSSPISHYGHHELHAPRVMTGGLSSEYNGIRGADSYALGWFFSNYRGETMIWHSGGLPGFTSMMLYFPRLQWGLTMMINTATGGALQVLVFELLDDMLGVPQEERYDWEFAVELFRLLELGKLRNPVEYLYPNAPRGKKALPISLPLEAYTGVEYPLPISSLFHLSDCLIRHTHTPVIPHSSFPSTPAVSRKLTQNSTLPPYMNRSSPSVAPSNMSAANISFYAPAYLPTSKLYISNPFYTPSPSSTS